MPEPKDRHNNRSQNGQSHPGGAKHAYEAQANSALRKTRVVAKVSGPDAGTENLSRSTEISLIEKLIAFFKDVE